MRKIAVAVLFASLAACRSEVPSPTQETAPPVASQPPAVVDVPSQQPATAPKSDVLVVYSSYAGYAVTNLSGKPQQYRAYITSFDDQSHELAFAVSGDVQQAHEWAGTFNRACVQLDLTQAGVAGTPFAYTYFDINGKEFTPSRTPEKVRECQPKPQPTPTPKPQCDGDCEPTPQPTPTPTPSPSPSPTPTPSPSPTPTPDPGKCYYRVSCGVSVGTHGSSCTDSNQEFICEHTYSGPNAGIWRNFGPQNLQNHCEFPVPGVSLLNFQLNPGQSARGCLNKNSD